MTTDYKDGKISFDLWDIIEYLPKEKLLEFIEIFSCHDEVIKHVTDQILERWTENTCRGSTSCFGRAEPNTGIERAWREVAKRSGEVAKEEITTLENLVKRKETENSELREEMEQFRILKTRLQ